MNVSSTRRLSWRLSAVAMVTLLFVSGTADPVFARDPAVASGVDAPDRAPEGRAVPGEPAPVPSDTDLRMATPRASASPRPTTKWIDTSNRAAVLAAYHAEFDRTEPTMGFTGDVATCKVGTTSSAYRASVMQRVNWYRRMAGTGIDVVEDPALSSKAQAAALIMSAKGEIGHAPPKTWPCWTAAGADGASKSNLYLGPKGVAAIDGYVQDPGAENTAADHRWWILNPTRQKMGTGDVKSARDANALLVVNDAIYQPGVAPVRDAGRFVSWPAPGFAPAATVHPRWSLQLDTATSESFTRATVTMKVDGVSVPVQVEADPRDRIVFVPKLPATSKVDAVVSVVVSGIEVNGRPVNHRWTTTIVSAAGERVPQVARGNVYKPVTPCRVVDTRAKGGRFTGATQRDYLVTGSGAAFAGQGGRSGGCGIPSNATAVEASVSAVAPTGGGFTRAWPAGQRAPSATFLNYTSGQAITNTGAISIADGGATQLTLRNYGGSTHYVVDVAGYYAPAATTGARFVALPPCRIVDTRAGSAGRLRHGAVRRYEVAGSSNAFGTQGGKSGGCGVPADATAVQASLSAVAPGGSGGFVRAWPAGQPEPTATALNYAGRQAITNTGALPLTVGGGSPGLDVKNQSGDIDLVVDVTGYFTTSGAGALYVPMTPCRIFDTRYRSGSLEPSRSESWLVAADGGIRAQGGSSQGCRIPGSATAIEGSLTAVAPRRSGGFTRAWAAGTTEPRATFLNYARGQSITNTGPIPVGKQGSDNVTIRNYRGTADYVLDAQGYFVK